MQYLSILRKIWRPWSAFVLLIVATVVQLHRQGRIAWCECKSPALWNGDIWSAHNSQHLLDPYSFTHVMHGVLFCGLLWLVLPRVRLVWRLWIATLIEAVWELLENSTWIIERYRSVTISLGYTGDSIANSLGDLACCAFGFLLACKLGFRRSALLFIATELLLLIIIRDNLTLNIIMLIHPIEAIKTWQMGQ